MNINQLETLIAVSQTMSFRKAGEQLNLTQPAVSAQIKALEEEFETILVDRTQPLSLTDSGKIFLQEAKRMMEIVEELKLKIADLKEIPQGEIILGTTTSIAMQVLPRVLSYYQDQYPLIKTRIYSMHSSQIVQSVEEGTIDIGIGYLFENSPALESSILYYDTFELIVSPEHPMSHLTTSNIESLQNIPLIMLSQDTAGRKFIDQVFAQYGITPQVIMELSSSEEVKRMVELNLGAAIVSKSSLKKELQMGTLKMIHISELETRHPVGVVYKAGRYLNSALTQFLNDLKSIPEEHFLGEQ